MASGIAGIRDVRVETPDYYPYILGHKAKLKFNKQNVTQNNSIGTN